MSKPKWEKCWKINCLPPLEVYETHINYYGSNVSIEDIDSMIKMYEGKAQDLKEAKKVWLKEFKK